jgi:hypothetical protein
MFSTMKKITQREFSQLLLLTRSYRFDQSKEDDMDRTRSTHAGDAYKIYSETVMEKLTSEDTIKRAHKKV